jgi:hypothetical protein
MESSTGRQHSAFTPSFNLSICMLRLIKSFTFDHRTLRTRLPVRSALFKQRTGGLVVRWVTTSEYPLLNVFAQVFFFYASFKGARRSNLSSIPKFSFTSAIGDMNRHARGRNNRLLQYTSLLSD